MSKADGSVVIEFDAETSDAQKDIDKLNEKVKSLETEQKEAAKAYNTELRNRDRLYDKLQKKQAAYAGAQKRTEMVFEQQAPVVQEIETTKAKIAEAEAEVKKYHEAWVSGAAGADKDQSAAQQTVDSLKEHLAELTKEVEKFDKSILRAVENEERLKVEVEQSERAWSNAKHAVRNVAEYQNTVKQDLEGAKDEAGKLAKELSSAAENSDATAEGVKKAKSSADKFAARMKKLAASALIFSVITQALRGFRNWLGDVIKATPEASAAVAKLKGALLTMAQPLVNVIIPAFTTLVNVLTADVSKLAEVFAFLAGTTVESSAQAAEALNEQTEALNSTGSAAKKAGKSLASFDEINKLSNSESASEIAPDFTGIGDMTFLTDRMQTIAEDIKAIFSDVKSFISNVFSGDWDDAIQNIMDFCNDVSQLLRDLLATADDIFGKLIDGIIEKFDLAGTPIGEMLEGIKGMVHNIVEMINDIVDGNWGKLASDFAAFLDNFRIFVNGIFELGKKIISSLLDWLDKKTHGRFSDIIGTVKQLVIGLIDSAEEIFNGLTDFLIGVFTGDWERAWLGVKKVFHGVFSAVVMVFESAINLIIKGLNWVIDKMNALLVESFIAKGLELVGVDFTGIPNIPKVDLVSKIPALAQGAVIPPNREFLAVLGDQKEGTNYEVPDAKLRQLLREELSSLGGKSEAVLMLDDIQLGKVVYRLNKQEGNRIGVSLVGV